MSTMLTTEEIDEPNQILILHKTFAHIVLFNSYGLKKPSHFIVNICKIALQVFESV